MKVYLVVVERGLGKGYLGSIAELIYLPSKYEAQRTMKEARGLNYVTAIELWECDDHRTREAPTKTQLVRLLNGDSLALLRETLIELWRRDKGKLSGEWFLAAPDSYLAWPKIRRIAAGRFSGS